MFVELEQKQTQKMNTIAHFRVNSTRLKEKVVHKTALNKILTGVTNFSYARMAKHKNMILIVI